MRWSEALGRRVRLSTFWRYCRRSIICFQSVVDRGYLKSGKSETAEKEELLCTRLPMSHGNSVFIIPKLIQRRSLWIEYVKHCHISSSFPGSRYIIGSDGKSEPEIFTFTPHSETVVHRDAISWGLLIFDAQHRCQPCDSRRLRVRPP